MEYQIDNIFPRAIYSSDNNQIDCDSLRNQAINMDKSLIKYYPDHRHSISLNHVLSEQQNSDCATIIKQHVEIYVKDVLQYQIPDQCYFEISDSWFVYLDNDNQSKWHYHAWSMISGILCLDSIGQTEFKPQDSTQFFDFDRIPENPYTGRQYHIPSIFNRLILWESDICHKPATDQPRLSLAFNIIPKGPISQHPSAKLTL